ncbi:PAS domain-containing sensor histidine kinase [Thiohalorhabdus sp. Cl-TMA]|uniref:histidine kinase n=1 Tax=Thiohalorhabdus methylotrophus TaxID=3242694 RepID=A0ABV4TR71_9GAMM
MAEEGSAPDAGGNSLRNRARQRLGAQGVDVSELSSEDIQAVVEELHIHQEELAIQNEELQEVQVELSEARDRYWDLFQHAPVGYLILDGQGCIREANFRATELLSITRSYAEGHPFSEFLAAGAQDAWYLHRRALSRYSKRQVAELTLAPADGHSREVLVETVPEANLEGAEPCYRSVLIDITKSKQDERDRIEGERRKDAFLTLLGHELRNPLTPIISTSGHLLEHWDQLDMGSERMKEAVQIIHQQGSHLARLVEELMDLSRIKQGRLTLRETEVDAREIARQAVDSIHPRTEEDRQVLSVDLPESPLPVFADPTRLEQILNNLLANANKFTPTGGTIYLTGFREGDQVVLAVSDTGRGLTSQQLSDIFQDVGQKPVPDADSGGLGLGLPLVRRLVELHGGKVGAESPGQGQGAKFIVRLPAHCP